MCMSRTRRAQTPFELCQYIIIFEYGNVEKSKELKSLHFKKTVARISDFSLPSHAATFSSRKILVPRGPTKCA